MIDRAVAQVLGGETISDFQGLRHLAPVTEAGGLHRHGVAGVLGGRRAAADPLNTAVTAFPRQHRSGLAARMTTSSVADLALLQSRHSTTSGACAAHNPSRTPIRLRL